MCSLVYLSVTSVLCSLHDSSSALRRHRSSETCAICHVFAWTGHVMSQPEHRKVDAELKTQAHKPHLNLGWEVISYN